MAKSCGKDLNETEAHPVEANPEESVTVSEEKSEVLKCANCGMELSEENKFCSNCGETVITKDNE